MRITTQMLHESQRKAGNVAGNPTLLDYVKNEGGSGSVWDALNKNSSVSDRTQARSFEKLEKSSDQLQAAAAKLAGDGEGSIFKKAEESGDTKEIVDTITDFVSFYNETIKNMKNTSGLLNDFYRDQLKALAAENGDALKTLGITMASDGTLSMNKDTLAGADLETLNRAFGSIGAFSRQVSFTAERIADNAKASADSFSSQYTSSGSAYSANFNSSKYSYWG